MTIDQFLEMDLDALLSRCGYSTCKQCKKVPEWISARSVIRESDNIPFVVVEVHCHGDEHFILLEESELETFRFPVWCFEVTIQ